MKVNTIVVALATASIAAAQPHSHRHRHRHVARDANPVQVVNVAGPTVISYVLNGQPISKADVDKGIADGSLVWVNGQPSQKKASPASKPAEKIQNPPQSQPSQGNQGGNQGGNQSGNQSGNQGSQNQQNGGDQGSSGSDTAGAGQFVGKGLDREFPNGQISCSEFPEEYGPIRVDWEGHNGWTGVQSVTFNTAKTLIDSIVTGTDNQGCTEGAYCSYACPAGYQKSQWPTAQGADAQSIGGLFCEGGKLKLNPGRETKLCTKGAGGVKIENNVGKDVAVCRTDYPGTESETVPVLSTSGSPVELTNPNESDYFHWQSKPASAQYYVNMPGVPVEKACTWGKGGSNMGNAAPVNIGVGKAAGTTWLSILPNYPTNNNVNMPMKIEILGDNGGTTSGTCKYENGQFYDSNGSNSQGCTVSVTSGSAKYSFSS